MWNKVMATDAPAAVILIRIVVGAVFLSEGIQKFLYPAEIGAWRFAKIGLPSPEMLGPFVGTVEIVCGTLVLLGLLTRLAVVPLIIIMVVAITSTKIPILMDKGFWSMAHDSRTDFAMLLGSVFLLIVGAGRYSIDHQLAVRCINENSFTRACVAVPKARHNCVRRASEHIAMMEEEVVRRRKWLKRDKFLDLLGATNLIPGPNSTELAIHIGYERGGWLGLIVSGVCFILPASLIVTAIAGVYVTYGALPEIGFILYGIKPVIIAIVVQALWGLATTAVKTKLLAAVGFVVLVLSFLRVNELLLLFAAGLFLLLTHFIKGRSGARAKLFVPLGLLFQSAPAAGLATFSLWALFLFFLKVGSVLFGSGYVLLAFLRGDLVERYGWLTNEQLLDAIAVGQITPGPVFTTATFIGYILGGGSGAFVATVGIFFPAFVFVALSGWLIPRLRRPKAMGEFLDGINVRHWL